VDRGHALGLGGAFFTTDGVNWQRLLDTAAMRGRPANCYFDWISVPADPALYLSFAGRSIVKISGFVRRVIGQPTAEQADRPQPATGNGGEEPADTRRLRIRTVDGRTGVTLPMPDDRMLITLDDGQSIIVETDRLQPQEDGSYVL
jgi:hypothetical protein